ncbi:MAG: hypothetical protein WA323_27890 [Candidatus Nitrosopolaris sp.]
MALIQNQKKKSPSRWWLNIKNNPVRLAAHNKKRRELDLLRRQSKSKIKAGNYISKPNQRPKGIQILSKAVDIPQGSIRLRTSANANDTSISHQEILKILMTGDRNTLTSISRLEQQDLVTMWGVLSKLQGQDMKGPKEHLK